MLSLHFIIVEFGICSVKRYISIIFTGFRRLFTQRLIQKCITFSEAKKSYYLNVNRYIKFIKGLASLTSSAYWNDPILWTDIWQMSTLQDLSQNYHVWKIELAGLRFSMQWTHQKFFGFWLLIIFHLSMSDIVIYI